jgi:methylated-DNA-[protein]-cysteine S-methyltransferase
MTEPGFALFDTAIGACAIAWGDRGILGVQLPEGDAARTRARIRRRFPMARETSPPAQVQQAIGGIIALIAGETVDFSAVALDMEQLPAFQRRLYEVVRTISCGATLTYGEIAKRLGVPARDVGEAMGRNPFPIIVPCHRVLAAGG